MILPAATFTSALLLILTLTVLPGTTFLLAQPQTPQPQAPDLEAQRERARRLLSECTQAPDPVLIQARAKAARRLFVEAGDPLGEGLSLLAIASVDVMLGDHEAGQTSFDRALEMIAASGDAVGAAVIRLSEAATWRSVGQYDKAMERLRQALEAFRELDGKDVRFSLESLHYFIPQQFPPELMEQAAPLLDLLKPALIQMFQSMALVEMAGVQRDQGLAEDALDTLDLALALPASSLADGHKILAEKADIELSLGRPARALELYEAALPLARQRGDLALQARLLRGAANAHESEGRREEAAEYRERADALVPMGSTFPNLPFLQR